MTQLARVPVPPMTALHHSRLSAYGVRFGRPRPLFRGAWLALGGCASVVLLAFVPAGVLARPLAMVVFVASFLTVGMDAQRREDGRSGVRSLEGFRPSRGSRAGELVDRRSARARAGRRQAGSDALLVELAIETRRLLEDLMREDGCTKSTLVNRAVVLYGLVRDIERHGGTLLLVEPHGAVRRVRLAPGQKRRSQPEQRQTHA